MLSVDKEEVWIFPEGQTPERLDCFVSRCQPQHTRSQIKRLIDDGQVLLNGLVAKAGDKLKGGEKISLALPPPVPSTVVPEAIPLRILYEDADLVVIDKPAGLVVHPAPGHAGGTLVNALLHHCKDLAGIGGELRPGIVHRLDKDTSGVLVVAKNESSLAGLAQQFKTHTVRRRYLALIQGLLADSTGKVDLPVGRHPVDRKKMAVVAAHGREAVTHWQVMARFPRDRMTLIALRLETGRTHQIRVHMAKLGFPVVGDPVYGHPGWVKKIADPVLKRLVLQLGRQALHADLLGFIHPRTGNYQEFCSALPADMAGVLQRLRENAQDVSV